MRFIILFLINTVLALDYSWDRLHACIAAETLKETVFDYLQNFPCLDCREHFRELVETHPFPLQNVMITEDARVWTWLTHNLVNVRLNKTWQSFDIMLECAERQTEKLNY